MEPNHIVTGVKAAGAVRRFFQKRRERKEERKYRLWVDSVEFALAQKKRGHPGVLMVSDIGKGWEVDRGICLN